MLTRTQLERIAQRHRINLQAQERDYIQHLFLYLLYTTARTQHVGLHFKGGTALRLVYGSPRFSEDLDFNSDLTEAETRTRLLATVSDLALFGVNAVARNQRRTRSSWGFDLSYAGPLFDGRTITKGKLRVDVSLRTEPVDLARSLVQPAYDDVEPFMISVLSLEHILAEKVRALLVRAKPRDLYDVWFLLQKGVMVNRQLIDTKLALYPTSRTLAALPQTIKAIKNTWGRDLKPLLATVPNFDEVQALVRASLR